MKISPDGMICFGGICVREDQMITKAFGNSRIMYGDEIKCDGSCRRQFNLSPEERAVLRAKIAVAKAHVSVDRVAIAEAKVALAILKARARAAGLL